MFAVESRRRLVGLAACLVVSGVSASAVATTESVMQATIPYEHPEVGGHCYQKVPVSVMVGIPIASLADAVVAPSYAFRSGQGNGGLDEVTINGRMYVNVNAAARGASITHTYVNDWFEKDTLVYEAQLDLTPIAALHGDTPEGRAQTVKQGKLALLALAHTAHEVSSNGLFKLFITLVGVPDQSGLTGEPLHETTQFPYTGGSPILHAYELELISEGCGGSGGKADLAQLTDDPSSGDSANSAGCSVSRMADNSGAAAVLLSLAGLAALRRRRHP